jgi:predicted nuclease with TOPRIM domain
MVGGQVMNNMMEMTNRMSEMPGKMSILMKDRQPRNIKNMFEVINGMFQQGMDMTKVMQKGTASEEDRKHFQDEMMQMQNRMSGLEKKKEHLWALVPSSKREERTKILVETLEKL